MTQDGKQEVAAVGHNSYTGTRFNAVKHPVLGGAAVDLGVQAQITEIRRIIIDPKVIEHDDVMSTETDT